MKVNPLNELNKKNVKPVVMLVVDTLMNPPLQETIKQRKAPAFQFMLEKGQYFPDLVTSFPAMSMNVDATLLTGKYCDEHKLPGLVWFNAKEKRLVNYGSSFKELWKLGLPIALEDNLYKLNHEHISSEVKTIHEQLDDRGFKTASLNALVYRGNTSHYFKLPKMVKWLLHQKHTRTITTPFQFSYGSLSKINPTNRYHHFWQKFGFNNSSSVQDLIYLIQNDKLSPFSIVYLPDLDKSVHKHGRMDIQGIIKVDKQLQKILNCYGSWEEALEQNIWITLGDNGQATISSDPKKAVIDLQKLLHQYQIMKLKKGVQPKDEIVLAVNQRMTYIYTLDKSKVPIHKLVKELQKEKRIDVIAWKEPPFIKVRSGEVKGEFRFKIADKFAIGEKYTDIYQQSWFVEGDMELLDINIEGNQLNYGIYPDALARLYSCLHSHVGDFLIVNAKPGCEFVGESAPTHVGGACHGGLHKEDSLVSMIINGTKTSPSFIRIVDLNKWVMSLIIDK